MTNKQAIRKERHSAVIVIDAELIAFETEIEYEKHCAYEAELVSDFYDEYEVVDAYFDAEELPEGVTLQR